MALNKCEVCEAMVSSKFENCPNCGSQLNVIAASTPNEIEAYTQQVNASDTKEKPSVALNIISFLIPIVGWILYFAIKSTIKAKSCGKWAWIGFGINLIISFISLAIS